jgi:molybdopterin synthase sulfur carrier subunit
VKVRLLFFAALREQLGKPAEEIDLPAAVTTVDELRAHLRSRGGAYEKIFSGKFLVRAAINQDIVQPGAAIKAGDEVAFFPPVTGG